MLVGAVLGPQRREQAELGIGRLAAEPRDDVVVLVGRETEAARQVDRDLGLSHACRLSHARRYRRRKPPSSTRLPSRDWRINKPSVPPIALSAARSGCGMRPSTVPSSFTMPAMLSSEPFGFDSLVTRPSA